MRWEQSRIRAACGEGRVVRLWTSSCESGGEGDEGEGGMDEGSEGTGWERGEVVVGADATMLVMRCGTEAGVTFPMRVNEGRRRQVVGDE